MSEYSKLDGLIRNITSKLIDVENPDQTVTISRKAQDWREMREGMHKLQSANSALQKQVEELEKSNAEYLVDLMALKCVSSQMHCAYCNHEMIDAHPGDGGVYIRKLVIEHMDKCEKHPLFEARKRIRELEAEVAGLKLILEKLQWVHQSDAYKFESYEGCLVCGSSIVEDHLENCVLNKALSTPTGTKLLDDLRELRRLLDCRAGKLLQDGKYFLVVCETEPYFSSVYEVIRLFEMGKGTWSGEDEIIYQKKVSNIRHDESSSESLELLIKLKAENSKLLEKVEAGEKLYCAIMASKSALDKRILKALSAYRKATIELEIKQVLSAYRATGEESEAGR